MLMRDLPAVMQQSLPASSLIRHEWWAMSRVRAAGLGICWVSAGGKEGFVFWCPTGLGHKLALGHTNHISLPQHQHTAASDRNGYKANLLPVRAVSAALHTSRKARLYPYNKVQGTELPGEKEMVKLSKNWEDSRWQKVKQTTPVEGTFIFPQETHKHATRSSQFNKDR